MADLDSDPDSEFELDRELHGALRSAPSDAELAALEAALAAAPGAGLAAFGDPRPSAATPARPSFRSSLRASFVSGRFEGDGAPPASVARALDAEVVPAPGAKFRGALRARFLAARTDDAPSAPVSLLRPSAGPSLPAAGTLRSARAVAPRGHSTGRERTAKASGPSPRRWPRFGVAAALAAVLLAAVLLRGQFGQFGVRSSDPASANWTVFGAGPVAGLLVDGAPVADRAALEARLSAGAMLETGALGLRLAVGHAVVIDLGPGTRARLPDCSAGGGLTFELERGALRVATGAEFQPAGGGRRLAIVTPHLEALAVGTVFGVDCTAEYSCVCCFEGEASVHALLPGGGDGRVGAGRTRLVYADGRVRDLDLVPHHRAPLVALREAWRA